MIWLTATGIAVLTAGVVAVTFFMLTDPGQGADDEQADDSPSDLTPVDPEPSESESSEADKQAALEESVDEYLEDNPGFSAAVSMSNGESSIGYHEDLEFETASIVKVEILTRWLLLREGQDLPPHELDLADRMITASDNDATNELCLAIAAESQVDSVPGGTDACVGDGLWGEDETNAAAQLEVLNSTLASDAVLDESSQDTVAMLMGEVLDDQNWGVSAACEDGESALLKNGWDIREGGWLAHSVGVVGDDLHMVVLTHGHDSEEEGIAHVEAISELARSAMDE